MSALLKLDIYDIGQIPPLGHVPRFMRAWTIRPERQGPPESALREEIVPVPRIGADEALILVMAAGLNYNGIWAALGRPVPVFSLHHQDFHIPGSDAAGIVWAVGDSVRQFKVGDEVVVHCHQDDGMDEECNGGDPMHSPTQRIWGYETPHGSFAQFTKVQARQLMPRPQHLGWEASSCYTLTLATAYRMLYGHPPHVVSPGSKVLIWGGAGGLGSMAIQLTAAGGGSAIAVVSGPERAEFVRRLGASGIIDRTAFECWYPPPPPEDLGACSAFLKEGRKFGAAIRKLTGGDDVDLVFEHPGAATFAISCLVCKRGGMVVFCASTTGYALTFDSRFVWTRQKRIQGSHFANTRQANAANRLVASGVIQPALGHVYGWHELPHAHSLMLQNRHPPGNHCIRVAACPTGAA